MKLLNIIWIYVKTILHLPIYRIDLLNWIEYRYIGKCPGLCSALDAARIELWIWPLPYKYCLPKYTRQYAQNFPYNYIEGGYWWKPNTWDIEGRLGFFYWLKDQYKNDKTNLRKINIE